MLRLSEKPPISLRFREPLWQHERLGRGAQFLTDTTTLRLSPSVSGRLLLPLSGGSGPPTLAAWCYRHTKILALERPSTRRTALHLFGVSLARVHVIEVHPLVLALRPPELSPEFVPLGARTIKLGHRFASLCGDTSLTSSRLEEPVHVPGGPVSQVPGPYRGLGSFPSCHLAHMG